MNTISVYYPTYEAKCGIIIGTQNSYPPTPALPSPTPPPTYPQVIDNRVSDLTRLIGDLKNAFSAPKTKSRIYAITCLTVLGLAVAAIAVVVFLKSSFVLIPLTMVGIPLVFTLFVLEFLTHEHKVERFKVTCDSLVKILRHGESRQKLFDHLRNKLLQLRNEEFKHKVKQASLEAIHNLVAQYGTTIDDEQVFNYIQKKLIQVFQKGSSDSAHDFGFVSRNDDLYLSGDLYLSQLDEKKTSL